MIFIGKSPYRISLLGGGSDLDWFVEKENFGISLGFTIKQSAYTVINKSHEDSKQGILNYSIREYYSELEQIVNPLIRESIREFSEKGIFYEITSFGFASGGSGLGGSSAFVLALLSALNLSNNISCSSIELAKQACKIEIEKLNKPIGRQDQYISAYGGISAWKYLPSGNVLKINLSSLQLKVIKKCIKNLYLIPTNINRSADKVLHNLKDKSSSYVELKKIRGLFKDFLEYKSLSEVEISNYFNYCVNESWKIKKEMCSVMNNELNDLYNKIEEIPNNWIRMIGAGGGGYFLLSSKLSIEETFSKLKTIDIPDAIKIELNSEGVTSNIF